MEPPTLERILRSALKAYENDFFIESSHKIPSECRVALDALLCVAEQGKGTSQETTPFAELRADPGRVSLESVLKEIAKLEQIATLGLPDDLFSSVPPKVLWKYRT